MPTEQSRSRTRPVGFWLLWMSFAVVVQISLGGVTRLTDSGLSITEWKPILGVIPPTSESGWQEAFAKYQQIPQFKLLKSHLSLDEFKFIYFWEWFHRLWGRLLGVFFLVPAIVFWRQGRIGPLGPRLAVLFVLGGLQGLLGWIMVASGLQDLVYVSHLRLAAHFMLAMVLLVALVWTGLELVVDPASRRGSPALRRATAWIAALLSVQLTWGAFMAGLKGALAAPTWPSINGGWFPSTLLEKAWWDDSLAVHFVHRNLAYLLVALVAGWWWRARAELALERHLVLGLVALQVVLGVLATVNAFFADRLLWLGAAHQLVGVLLLVALVAAGLRLVPARPEPEAAAAPAPA